MKLKTFLYILVCFVVVSCSNISYEYDDDDFIPLNSETLVVDNIIFDNDLRHFTATINISSDIDPLILADSTSGVSLRITERRFGNIIFDGEDQPRLTSCRFIAKDSLLKLNRHVVLLVDRTLPQNKLDRIHEIASHLNAIFERNVHMAFIDGTIKTPVVPVNNQIMSEYLVNTGKSKYTLRSLYNVLNHLQDSIIPNTQLVIFSDGLSYDNSTDESLDPNHISVEDSLIDRIEQGCLPRTLYVNMAANDEVPDDEEAVILIKRMVHKTGGIFIDSLNVTSLSSQITNIGTNAPEYQLSFTNPIGKRYTGVDHTLTIELMRNGEILASGTGTYNIGFVYDAMTVGNVSTAKYFVNFLFISVFLLLVTFVTARIIGPLLRYRLWYRKNVYVYSGSNMSAGGNIVSEHCCYCKDQFVIGDRIVAACQHHMHLECWNDNGCKCPEHGYHNHHSEHYFNRNNLLDARNTTYNYEYVLWGIIAGLCIYTLYLVLCDMDNLYLYKIISSLISDMDTTQSNILASYSFDMPVFGALLGAVTTFYLLSMRRNSRHLYSTFARIMLISLSVGLVSYLIFLAFCLLESATNIYTLSFFTNWIPFVLASYVMMWVASRGSHISKKKQLWGMFLSVGIGLLCTYFWALASRRYFFIDMHLIASMAYCIGMGLTLASERRISRNYFLHVTGQTKEIDIAVFKLLRTGNEASLTLGRSVDCDIQISWDTESVIEPIMARMHRKYYNITIEALEPGMTYEGEPLPIHTPKPLSHGTRFTIGRTTFTFLEKDK